jgi:hypothetical protein
MTSEISKLKGRLKANPVYCMSLGSRELFHSNLLGWMFEKYPRTVSVLTEPVRPVVPDCIKVEREKKNMDLLVTFSEATSHHAIVVEVKVKDVPGAKQLTAYDGEIKKLAESSLRGYAVRVLIWGSWLRRRPKWTGKVVSTSFILNIGLRRRFAVPEGCRRPV